MSVAPTAFVPSYVPAQNVSAGTPAPVERGHEAPAPRRVARALVAGAVLVVAAGAVAFVLSQPSDGVDEASEGLPTAEPSSAAGARSPEPPPAVEPVEPPPAAPAASSAAPAASTPPTPPAARAAPAAKSAPAAAAPAARRPAPAASSRTSTHGLVESNPFR
jgi:hypothetical protein